MADFAHSLPRPQLPEEDHLEIDFPLPAGFFALLICHFFGQQARAMRPCLSVRPLRMLCACSVLSCVGLP